MDYLWTPWRYRYVSKAKGHDAPEGEECVFCRVLRSGEADRDTLVVYRGKRNFVMLNRYPYTSGHVMVIPYDHVSTLVRASRETIDEMMLLTQRLEGFVRKLYEPDGVNLGMNIGRAAGAGVAGHIHMHVLPRWFADSNFVTVVGETRVLPEALSTTWQRVQAEFLADPP